MSLKEFQHISIMNDGNEACCACAFLTFLLSLIAVPIFFQYGYVARFDSEVAPFIEQRCVLEFANVSQTEDKNWSVVWGVSVVETHETINSKPVSTERSAVELASRYQVGREYDCFVHELEPWNIVWRQPAINDAWLVFSVLGFCVMGGGLVCMFSAWWCDAASLASRKQRALDQGAAKKQQRRQINSEVKRRVEIAEDRMWQNSRRAQEQRQRRIDVAVEKGVQAERATNAAETKKVKAALAAALEETSKLLRLLRHDAVSSAPPAYNDADAAFVC